MNGKANRDRGGTGSIPDGDVNDSSSKGFGTRPCCNLQHAPQPEPGENAHVSCTENKIFTPIASGPTTSSRGTRPALRHRVRWTSQAMNPIGDLINGWRSGERNVQRQLRPAGIDSGKRLSSSCICHRFASVKLPIAVKSVYPGTTRTLTP